MPPVDREAVPLTCPIDEVPRNRGDLRPDAVAGEMHDVVRAYLHQAFSSAVLSRGEDPDPSA